MKVTDMVESFEVAAKGLVDKNFPKKNVTVTEGDLPYFTEELKISRRRRNRIYQRTGKSEQYQKIKQEFEQKLVNEATKYKNKILEEVKDGKRGSGYSAIRRLGDGQSD